MICGALPLVFIGTVMNKEEKRSKCGFLFAETRCHRNRGHLKIFCDFLSKCETSMTSLQSSDFQLRSLPGSLYTENDGHKVGRCCIDFGWRISARSKCSIGVLKSACFGSQRSPSASLAATSMLKVSLMCTWNLFWTTLLRLCTRSVRFDAQSLRPH